MPVNTVERDVCPLRPGREAGDQNLQFALQPKVNKGSNQ